MTDSTSDRAAIQKLFIQAVRAAEKIVFWEEEM